MMKRTVKNHPTAYVNTRNPDESISWIKVKVLKYFEFEGFTFFIHYRLDYGLLDPLNEPDNKPEMGYQENPKYYNTTELTTGKSLAKAQSLMLVTRKAKDILSALEPGVLAKVVAESLTITGRSPSAASLIGSLFE